MKPLPTAPPWDLNVFIQLPISLLQPAFSCGAWKEDPHENILDCKDRIAKLESAEEWEMRKKITNPYEAIFSGVEDGSFPSLVRFHPLSRSYFKMVEMLRLCGFWEQGVKGIRSAHVCEGPGGFIQCLVDQANSRKIPIQSIHAMTLKPSKSHIPGWRRSLSFLRKVPQITLEYGEDGTGNILHPGNQIAFSLRAKDAQIFTADGGFDFSVDYTKQEQFVFPLLLASFLIGLRTLAKEGIMIIKLFDMYSPVTRDLILGSGTCFKEFTLYKPATSRPCNAERYFIGKGYVGQAVAHPWIQHLEHAQKIHAQTPLTRLCESWPNSVEEAMREQIHWQEHCQIQAIEQTLQLSKEDIEEYMRLNLQQSKEWCRVFEV